MIRLIEQTFEWILWQSRTMIIFAVFASIVSALILIVVGTYDIIMVIKEFFHAFETEETFVHFHSSVMKHIISSLDVYLVATVVLIFGIGLYELFISKIEYAEKDIKSSKILIVHNLDELKEKLAKVIIMVLIVTFFKYALDVKFDSVLNLLYLSMGVLLLSISVFFMSKGHGNSANKQEDDNR
ncbi:MAG: YqhA family protein [Candidatus Magnetoovum sp. WYHC-5]|nr:YqhA family protein [Candidatus Magnetoovum sp. WYHC-5]